MLSPENRALIERMIAPDCYRPTDTTFGFTERGLNDLLNAARADRDGAVRHAEAQMFDSARKLFT